MVEFRTTIGRYAYPQREEIAVIPATLVGDLAVHRGPFWGEGELPDAKTLTLRGKWTVSHIPSGLSLRSLASSLPQRKADMVQWARDIQAACPEAFAVLRLVPFREPFAPAREVSPEERDAQKALVYWHQYTRKDT